MKDTGKHRSKFDIQERFNKVFCRIYVEHNVFPIDVTAKHFWSYSAKYDSLLSEWFVRKHGGFMKYREGFFAQLRHQIHDVYVSPKSRDILTQIFDLAWRFRKSPKTFWARVKIIASRDVFSEMRSSNILEKILFSKKRKNEKIQAAVKKNAKTIKKSALKNNQQKEFFYPVSEEKTIITNPKIKIPNPYVQNKLENFKIYKDDIINGNESLHNLFAKAKLSKNDVFRVIVQPDTHVPEHDPSALDVFLQFCRDYKPHAYINLGDFVEMSSVSQWTPLNPSPRRLVPEIAKAREILDQINDSLGPQCISKYFLIGNHENWLNYYLVDKIPEMFDGLDSLGIFLNVESLLQLEKRGFHVVPFNEILQLGDLYFIHGYYTNQSHAEKHLRVFGCNLMYGHVHDVQSYSGVSVKGLHEAISIGCLRTLNAPFMRNKPNNWTHAFGVVEYRIDGRYTRYVPIIVNAQFSFNGKLYKSRVAPPL